MKATLTFTLPEEIEEFKDAQRGVDYRCILRELDEYLRGIVKYGNTAPPMGLDDEQWAGAADEVREKLRDLFNEYDVTID